MKRLNIEKISLIIILLLSIHSVKSIGISSPMPVDLKLLRGDSARFYFEIMATTSQDKILCTYSASNLDPLEITFDTKQSIVNPGDIKPVLGTISVPVNAPIKTYTGNLAANCAPYTESENVSGSTVTQSMNVGFNIKIVEQNEERAVNSNVPEKEKPKTSPIILVLIIIVLILSIVGFYFSRKKKTE